MTPWSTVTSRLRSAGGPSADRSRIDFSVSQTVDGRPGARTANTTRLRAVARQPRLDRRRGRLVALAMSNAAAAAAHSPSKLKSGRSFTIRCVGSTSRPGSSARARNIIA